jgi:hypothetical protein
MKNQLNSASPIGQRTQSDQTEARNRLPLAVTVFLIAEGMPHWPIPPRTIFGHESPDDFKRRRAYAELLMKMGMTPPSEPERSWTQGCFAGSTTTARAGQQRGTSKKEDVLDSIISVRRPAGVRGEPAQESKFTLKTARTRVMPRHSRRS